MPDLATRSGFSTDVMGRLLTDETLSSIDDPRIVAAGDAAAPSVERHAGVVSQSQTLKGSS